MNHESSEKITLTLPSSLYHALRDQAYKKGLSLPDFIRQKVDLKPSVSSELASLPLSELIRKTEPKLVNPDASIDFYA